MTRMDELARLGSLIPINALHAENLRELSAHVRLVRVAPGEMLFRVGDVDRDTIYLLEGDAALTARSGETRTLSGGSEDARYALSPQIPRQHSALTRTGALVARVETARLDRVLTLDQSAGESGEAGEGNVDWMFRMLRHPALDKVPAGRLMALFEKLVPVAVTAGEIVIRQGDPGDFYFIIKSGRARVDRASADGRVATLAELGVGDSFGEEALLSAAPRNASVVALTDGTLMRLSQQDFDRLLREPLVRAVQLEKAQEMARLDAGLIDVRTEDEFQRGAIKGAVNIPLYLLRVRARQLPPKRKYILYCDNGDRSAAAAFLLSQRGFDVCVLAGGLNAVVRAP